MQAEFDLQNREFRLEANLSVFEGRCRVATEAVKAYKMDHARVAKLADALDLGSCALIGVGVRLPPLAIAQSARHFLSVGHFFVE